MSTVNKRKDGFKHGQAKFNFTIILRNITDRLFIGKLSNVGKHRSQSVFSINVGEQKRFLRAFPEPKDLFERSYFQYKFQLKQLSAVLVIVQNIAALVLLPVYYIKLVCALRDTTQQASKNCAIFFAEGVTVQTIPDCLSAEYNEIIPCKFAEEIHLGKQEKKLLVILLKRYWYSPYFVFKCMLKIGMYGAKIEKFNPRAIISCSEYSFTSSVLTDYCRLRKVEHINIMHGEKLFNTHDAFVQYDRYYVWDEHYINLLTDLRVDKGQFRIAVPHTVKLDIKGKDEPIYNYTYYLSGDKDEKLLSIRDALLRTCVPSSHICIRYHPRYSNANEIKRVYIGFQIENPAEVPLNISLSRTRFAVSLYSTVLYQAYESGKEIIIDDMTDREKYEKLKELRYIMVEKPHRKFSEHLSGCED